MFDFQILNFFFQCCFVDTNNANFFDVIIFFSFIFIFKLTQFSIFLFLFVDFCKIFIFYRDYSNLCIYQLFLYEIVLTHDVVQFVKLNCIKNLQLCDNKFMFDDTFVYDMNCCIQFVDFILSIFETFLNVFNKFLNVIETQNDSKIDNSIDYSENKCYF